MKFVFPIALSLLFFISCKKPWMAPHGHFDATSPDLDHIYELIKIKHRKYFKNDHIKWVFKIEVVKRNYNEREYTEKWSVTTESGIHIAYNVWFVYGYSHSSGDAMHGNRFIMVLDFEKIQ